MLRVNGLSVAYENKEIINALSFQVDRGDYLAIVGENGSGKTTLMKAMLGLKSIKSGNIDFQDFHRIGYVPQLDESQKSFPALVKEIVITGILEPGFKNFFFKKSDRKKVDEVLERVGILDLKNRPFKNLSGGQKQRVLLARALIRDSDILFLDEPTTGLDPLATSDFYEELDRLNDEGMTIIIISHDIKSVISCAKTVLHLSANSGESLYFGGKDDYLKTPYYESISEVHIHG